jgi:hypothetical protein
VWFLCGTPYFNTPATVGTNSDLAYNCIETVDCEKVSRFRVNGKVGHVRCRLLGSQGSGGFWGSGRVAVRTGLWVGQVFGQEGGFRGTKIGQAFGPHTIVYFIHEREM